MQERHFSLFVMYLSSLELKYCAGSNPILSKINENSETYIRSSRSVICKKSNSCFVLVLVHSID